MSVVKNPHEVIENADGTVSLIRYEEVVTSSGVEKYKLTEKIRNIFALQYISSSVVARKKWKKFGSEKYSPPGPNHSTTQLGEEVYLLLGSNWRELEEEQAKIEKKKQDKSIKCKFCSGPHFTVHCPRKSEFKNNSNRSNNSLNSSPVNENPSFGHAELNPVIVDSSNSSSKNSDSTKHSPHPTELQDMVGQSQGQVIENEEVEETFTIKISQLNANATEQMLRDELLSPFDNLQRFAIIKNRDTGKSRGFAFVTFTDEESAEDALYSLNGKGFMNLILHVEWAVPRD